MPIRNKRPDLNGLLVVDKPLGWTSADVCRRIRRVTRGAKVGHAGTLDPLATGVLVVCLGRATKSIAALMATEKRYRAEIDLSAFSTTDDAEGDRTPIDVACPPSRERIVDVIGGGFVGEIEQRPPAYSAVKIDGERAYRLARSGQSVVPSAKRVVVHAIDLVGYAWPRLVLDIRCGKGTYVRSIARDLGTAIGTGGMLSCLVRTAVGPYRLNDARSPDELPDEITPESLLPPPPPSGGSDAGGSNADAAQPKTT